MRKLHLILLWLLPIYTVGCLAQDQNKKEEFDELLKYCYQNNMFNGNVLVIGKNNAIIYEKSFGFNGKDLNTPLTSDSQFLLASLSKQFTAMGIMILKEKGKLNYNDLVISHLKDFPYKNISIRNLLNQTSGIPEYQGFLNKNKEQILKRFKEKGKIITNQDVYNLVKATKPKLEFTPGDHFNYSNTNYVLLAMLIEHITNSSYSEFMDEHIFLPLKMDNSYVYNAKNNNASKNRAYGYKLDIDRKTMLPNDVLVFFNTVGDGGIYSTTKDLYRWLKALSDNTLVKKETFTEVYETPILKNNKKAPYGFGWFVKQLPVLSYKSLTHSGEFVGFSNSIFFGNTEGNKIIMLSNNSSQYRPELNQSLTKILYGFPYEMPKIKSNEFIAKLIYKVGIEKAIKKYREVHENNANQYDYDESYLNRLGYQLIKKDKLKEAIEIFKLNVEYYPNSANVYDSLGEAYLLNTEKEAALFNYKKSLELNPDNRNAVKVIKRLSNTN
ncbi:hypothetical protein ATO12_08150 [Aquimarina atlantica]|uniref:Beta-lactamase-related domain-containing protein n=1 Tax=Aquimarina atlantica TaxID=1317122 RepID=A0A023BMX6_9FLAO|nr:serine hydrolase domain-containing protein [Aquimarina atlantica]EZH71351.1 hypothetical protein ATO12_08150 [Aquimarina atlantica]